MREESIFGVAVCYFTLGILFGIYCLVNMSSGEKTLTESMENLQSYDLTGD